MAENQNYSFLEVISESEAASKGINISDKLSHSLLKTIRAYSTVKMARNDALFVVGSEVFEAKDVSNQEVIQALKRLVNESIVAQLFKLHYHTEEAKIKLTPCFVSLGEEDKDSVKDIYYELIRLSASSLETYLQTVSGFDPDGFWSDMQIDLSLEGNRPPAPTRLKSSIVRLFEPVHAGSFEVMPSMDMLNAMARDIEMELVSRGRVVRIPMYGLMPIKNDSILGRFESASDFMKSRLIPLYRENSQLGGELDQIDMEEAEYYSDEFAPRTSSFTCKRAAALSRVMALPIARFPEGTTAPSRLERAPGMLAIATLQVLETLADEKYKEKHREENQKELAEIKNQMNNPQASWDQMILFFTDSEYEGLSPAIREGLNTDRNILYGTWEEPGVTIHVFLRNDPYAFRSLVQGMSLLPPSQHWQVLALRHILDLNDDHYENLFEDKAFVQLYGKLLRQVYTGYMPFLHRFLLSIGITFLQDRAFTLAKEKIRQQQNMRSLENRERSVQAAKEREEEKKKKIRNLKKKSTVSLIIQELDRHYFEQFRIPSIHDLRSKFSDYDQSSFQELLKKEQFQMVSVRKGEDPEDRVVLYPLDQDWRVRFDRLKRVVERIVHTIESSGKEDFESKLMMDRAKKVASFLDRNRSGAGASQKILKQAKQEVDPYERFGEEIKKFEKQNATPDLAETEDERDS